MELVDENEIEASEEILTNNETVLKDEDEYNENVVERNPSDTESDCLINNEDLADNYSEQSADEEIAIGSKRKRSLSTKAQSKPSNKKTKSKSSKKKPANKKVTQKRTSRPNSEKVYKDPDSDEFDDAEPENENTILGSDNEIDDEDNIPTNNKTKNKTSGTKGFKNKSIANSDKESFPSPDIQYKVKYIIGRKSLTKSQWRQITEHMNTAEIERGSVLKEADDKYYSDAPDLVEKFLIKWTHASFLHVSWEVESDLIELIGPRAKVLISKYLYREMYGPDLFDDLGVGEYFPLTYLTVERILDVDDNAMDMLTVDWKDGKIPDGMADIPVIPDMRDSSSIGHHVVGIESESDLIVDSTTTTAATSSTTKPTTSMSTAVITQEIETGTGVSAEEEEVEERPSPPHISNNKNNNNSTISQPMEISEEIKVDTEKVIETEQTPPPLPLPSRQAKTAANIAMSTSNSNTTAKLYVRAVNRAGLSTHRGQHKHSTSTSSTKNESSLLHTMDCYVTVKWSGLPYADTTFERIQDLKARGVEYETCMREFFKREQKNLVPLTGEPSTSTSTSVAIRRNVEVIQKETPPPLPGGGILRDYQWEGVRWLLFNWSQNRNSILADEMGLGKTIQTASFLQILKSHQKLKGPFLIVAPLSTLVNWQRELQIWTDMDVVVYHGLPEDREIIRDFEFYSLSQGRDAGYKIEIVVTTPEICMAIDKKDCGGRSQGQAITRVPWELLVVDEAHRLKNYSSKIAAKLRDDFHYNNCLLLTGTPLQNNIEELWTLLNFIARVEFNDRLNFINTFGNLQQSEQVDSLHTQLRPYLLQRKKETVEKMIPPKEEHIIEVELTMPQKQYYRALYEHNRTFLQNSKNNQGPSFNNLVLELRKCCNHPFLIKGAEAKLLDDFKDEVYIDVLVKTSGKLVLLDKLLPKLRTDGHKVLIFSQFRIMLDILVDYLDGRHLPYERVDGSITGRKRQAAIDRFSTPTLDRFVMLLSTRAGGVGINLTSADTVIIFDSDWNPQNDMQAQARAHRIGQTKPVKVYRLLTNKTYEHGMFAAASLKLGLDYAIMHNMGLEKGLLDKKVEKKGKKGRATVEDSEGKTTDAVAGPLSKTEIERLLKYGAYDIF
eukprot:gene8363-17230_t